MEWNVYIIWLCIFIIIVFLLWLFYGGQRYEFIGLKHPSTEINTEIKEIKIKRSKGEELCCKLMEEITGKSFRKIRPIFLRNPKTGYNLELDGYNEELKIAIEYNGLQHYLWPNVFHKTEQEFRDLVWRDQFKREKCDTNGIYLITVPYHIPFTKIKQYLIDSLPSTLILEEESTIENNI